MVWGFAMIALHFDILKLFQNLIAPCMNGRNIVEVDNGTSNLTSRTIFSDRRRNSVAFTCEFVVHLVLLKDISQWLNGTLHSTTTVGKIQRTLVVDLFESANE